MFSSQRLLVLCACSLTLLAGCGANSYNSTSGASSVPQSTSGGTGGSTSGGSGSSSGGFSLGGNGTGTHDTIVATPAIAGVISAEVGIPLTVSVTFNSSDGKAMTGFALSDTLLPPGWTLPGKSSGCAMVSTGSGCVLNFIYAPTAYDSGETLTLNYLFVDNDAEPHTVGSTTLSYRATTNDNIVGSIAPTGQIAVVVASSSASQSVIVTFNTDDGHPASGLNVTTDLTALPAGWSSSVASFNCATVSTGNGCELMLSYAPTAYSTGTLVINYAYADDSGTAKVGMNNIPYISTTNDNVVATASMSGQINAVAGTGSQTVDVAFTTDDNAPATNLDVTTDLTSLPAGWSSTSSTFSCANVGAGVNCQLPLMYAPTTAGSGTVLIGYSYVDDAGEAKTGSLNIPYKSTSNNNISGQFNPSGLAVSAGSTNAVTLTFATDDAAAASGLSITSGLDVLPAGWSAASNTFTCSTVSAGPVCSLALSYAPTAADSGILTFGFAYSSGSGVAKTGSAHLTYSATP